MFRDIFNGAMRRPRLAGVYPTVAAVFPITLHIGVTGTQARTDAELDGIGLLDFADIQKRLNSAFLARYGVDVGPDVTAETMAWAWEHRYELSEMQNQAGYLYRVGQSKSRRLLRWQKEQARFPAEPIQEGEPWSEPGLPDALAKLDEDQRTILILVHCLQWTYKEVAELIDVELHTVRNRLHRGLQRLREELGVQR